MAPQGWSTTSQKEFLTGFMAQYLEAAVKKKYQRFWPLLFEEWFAKFPEPVPPMQPGEEKLTPEQLRGNAITKRQKVYIL